MLHDVNQFKNNPLLDMEGKKPELRAKLLIPFDTGQKVWPVGTELINVFYDNTKHYCGTLPDGKQITYIMPECIENR